MAIYCNKPKKSLLLFVCFASNHEWRQKGNIPEFCMKNFKEESVEVNPMQTTKWTGEFIKLLKNFAASPTLH